MGSRLPLEGVRILDFFWQAAGPLASRTFAHFGAEVIRVESSTRPCTLRTTGARAPDREGLNVCHIFNNLNTNKLSIALNLNHPRGLAIAKRLVALCDVVTNSFTGDRMERWGLGYEELVKVKPDIIMITMPVLGATGPYRHYRAWGSHIIAGGGLNYLTGMPGRPPTGIGTLYSDFSANPFHAVVATMAALRHRNRTGRGQFIDVAQYESTICFAETAILDYTVNHRVQGPNGNRLPYAAPHGVYRCQGDDRWCAIGVFTEGEWKAFTSAIGSPDWTQEERFASLPGRKQHEDELDRLVEEWTSERTPEAVMATLQAAGVAAGIVQTAEDLLTRDPQMRERHYRVLEHPEMPPMNYDGQPIKMTDAPVELRRAPLLGEHNDHIYRELLGLAEDEINDYMIAGVFE
jgi:crotonobetainyl-CoA:carnitine CoA-transferase CaiB-like acyl-CoA transferase